MGSSTLPGSYPTTSPSLRGTSWEGCTLQHLLDMRAGTRFDEDDYDNPDSDGRLIEQVSGYTSRVRDDIPSDTYQWIAQLPNDEHHGGMFKYRSILPDALAWVMCAATGQTFPELFSEHIWSQFADRDADIIVDAAGFPVVEGGICTTLDDLARFGVMCLQHGQYAGRRDRARAMDAPANDPVSGTDRCVRVAKAVGSLRTERLLPRLLVGVRQRRRHLLRVGHQRADVDDQSSRQHRHRQVLDVA